MLFFTAAVVSKWCEFGCFSIPGKKRLLTFSLLTPAFNSTFYVCGHASICIDY